MLPADLRRPGCPRACQLPTDPPRPVHRPFAVPAPAGAEDAGRFQPVPADGGGARVRGRAGHRDHAGQDAAGPRPVAHRHRRRHAERHGRGPAVPGQRRAAPGDQFLGADKLTYDSEQEHYVADGNIRYQDSSMRLTAEHAEGNQAADEHQIDDLKYQLVSRRGNGESSRINLHGAQGSLHDSTYSTCDPEDRNWELRAKRIDVDSADGFAVAHHAVLRIGHIPVLYVPWFEFPIDERRHTGLLFPSASSSSRNGFDYKQPIYLNLAPNYDATLYPRIMSSRGTQLGAEFRYLGQTGQASVSGAYMPHDDLRKDQGYDERYYGAFNGFKNLSPSWQARANLLHISDPRYFEDFNSSINGISVYAANSSAGLFGRGRFWTAGLMADQWQLADYTLSESSLAYNRLPRAFAAWEQRLRPWLLAGVDSEAVRFQKDQAVFVPPPPGAPAGTVGQFEAATASRLDIKPYISFPLEGASWFLRPTLAWRYTAYQLDDLLATAVGSSSRSLSRS